MPPKKSAAARPGSLVAAPREQWPRRFMVDEEVVHPERGYGTVTDLEPSTMDMVRVKFFDQPSYPVLIFQESLSESDDGFDLR